MGSSNGINTWLQQNTHGQKEYAENSSIPMQTTLQASLLRQTVGRPNSSIGYPSVNAGNLNVTNPLNAAKYGNPYLRDSLQISDLSFPNPPSYEPVPNQTEPHMQHTYIKSQTNKGLSTHV